MFHAYAGRDCRTRDFSCEHEILLLNTNNANNTNVPRLSGKGLEDTGFIRGSNL